MAETLDIANLGTEAIDLGGDYEAPSEFFRPPEPTGAKERTNLQLNKAPEDSNFYPLKDFDTKQPIRGFAVNLNFKIIGGLQDGKTFFTMIDTRKKANRPGNDVIDFLRSAGFTGRLVMEKDYIDALQSYVGTAQAKLTWTGDKCQICDKKTIKNINGFPLKADGITRNHVTECPDCGEPVGARVKIAMFFVSKEQASS